MKVFIFILISIYSFSYSKAQLVKQWDNRFGGTQADLPFSNIIETKNGYLLSGWSYGDSSYDKSQNNWSSWPDFWIVKSDLYGNKIWDKRFGGYTAEILYASSMAKDGGYLLGGYSNSDSGGNKTSNNRGFVDYWIVKIDSNGTYLWDKTFGGIEDEVVYSIVASNDGGFLLAGYSNSDSSADKSQNNWTDGYYHADYWVIKIDSLGNKQWDKRYGGLEMDECKAAIQLKDGSYLLVGSSRSAIGGDKTENTWDVNNNDYWLVKIDANGNKIWDRDLGGIQHDACYAVAEYPNGNIVLGGESQSTTGGDKSNDNWGEFPDQDFWILMLDSLGNKIWDNHFGGEQNESLQAISITMDGAILASGESSSHITGDKTENGGLGSNNAWMIKIDSNGNKIWDKTLVNNAYNGLGYAIESSDGGYVIATASPAGIGGDKSQDSRGDDDFFFAKYKVPIQFSADTTVCQKDCISFNNLTGYSAVSWSWLFPGGSPSSSTEKNPLVCYNTPGAYDVTLIAFYGGKYDTLTKINYITVYPTPATPVITQLNDTLICSSAIAYQWYLNQQIISGATNQKYVAAQWGEYSVAIKDENDCTSFSQNFEVNVIDISVATRFQIFPNPVGDILNVSFSSPDYSILDLKILNPLGQLLFQKEIVSEKQLQIPKSVFNGSKIVLCELLKDGKLIAMQKVVIE